MQKTTFNICGNRQLTNPKIWVDGKELNPSVSRRIHNHSPDGFNWGYSGSGPAQTALAICLEIFADNETAVALYQAFKYTFVAQWRQDIFNIDIDIAAFLLENKDLLKNESDQQDS